MHKYDVHITTNAELSIGRYEPIIKYWPESVFEKPVCKPILLV